MLWHLARLIFATSVVALAALGAGSWLQKLLPADFSRLERLACCWLGGFGLLGAALFLVGQIAFTPLTISLVLALGVLASIGPLMRALKVAAGLRQSIQVRLIPAGVVALVLLLTAVAGLADITGDWGNDGVAYHLLGPKVWLRDGVIRPVLDNSHTAFPATAEVMYAAFLVLGGPHGPGFSAVLTLSMFLFAVAALSVRAGLDAGDAWWAAAFVAAMPAIYAGAHSGFVDVLYASFVLAAARIGLDAVRPKHFLAFGLFCGFAIATKYTGLLALPALLLDRVAKKSVCSGAGDSRFAAHRRMVRHAARVTLSDSCLRHRRDFRGAGLALREIAFAALRFPALRRRDWLFARLWPFYDWHGASQRRCHHPFKLFPGTPPAATD